MKKGLLISIAASTMIFAGGDIAPVASAPVDNWSGFYGGIQAGYAWNDLDVDYTRYRRGNADNTAAVHGLDVDGSAAGLYAGYNWLMDNGILLGVEGEINMVGADDSGLNVNPKKGTDPRKYTVVEQNWDAALLARAGMVMDNYLPYVIGGVAWGNFDVTKYGPKNKKFNTDMTLTGWTVGAGLEMVLSENLHARIQYRYTDYGDDTKLIKKGNGQGNPHTDAKLDVSNSHQVMVGLTFRF